MSQQQAQNKAALRPDVPSSDVLDGLRADAQEKLQQAEKAWYAYFCECEVGPDRSFAHMVYQRLLYAQRR
jgi:hypothetical protein